MSNAIFTMPDSVSGYGSYGFPIKQTPRFNTVSSTSVNNRMFRRSMTPFPIWVFEIDLPYLVGELGTTNSGVQQIVGFYGQMKGAFDDWLLDMPFDNTVPVSSPATFGVGDGSTKVFQLVRPISNLTDIIQNLNGAPILYDNGTTVNSANYSISNKGVVTFTVAPVLNHILTWSGQFFYRCHFTEDDWGNLMQDMYTFWSMNAIKFESVIV